MDKPFAHLHLHTEYSMLDGSSKINELVARVKSLGMDSVAITDHGVMYGAVDFYKACQKEGIHPVIGCEVYVAPRSRFDKAGKIDSANYHLILLAESQKGYENLTKLVSLGFIDGFYYKPRIDWELLEKYHEGIIATTACLGGQLPQLILQNRPEEAKELALKYRDLFGKDNYYIELQRHNYEVEKEKKVNDTLVAIARELGVGLVATNDSHYTYEDDAKSHDVLLCIQTNKKVADEDRMRYWGGQFYVKSPDEMYDLFSDYPEALENTEKIAKRCQVDFEFGVTKLPRYDVPEGFTAKEYLRKLCNDGLRDRYGIDAQLHQERLDYELSVIENMGYVDYFLIVWDFIRYARDHGIIVGPGRGSAAGSIVAYSLKITAIDPIRYSLIFERFLNPERVSMPDIDIDFGYERRGEVIDYVIEKYGKDKVAQIITFGTMAARGVIRDVGRAYDMGYAEVDKIAKMIPNELKITIDKALKVNHDLSDLYENDPKVHQLIDTSKRLEGLARHSSIHAAGVVICDRPVYDYVPLNAGDDSIITQFTMGTLEELGLLKMDFLGLRTLTVIQNSVEAVNRRSDIEKALDIDQWSYDDPNVYAMISQGKTEGVFQLESEGMKNFMKELKPQNIEDIIAGISLYRPGPMSSIPMYVKGRHHSDEVQYIVPELEPILKPTYGCIVYQEQVMQIVRDLAGYTLGRSDLVRRAMSKKKTDVMVTERQNFIYGNEEEGIDGCIKRGIPEAAAIQIFADMEDFAKYAFNKSHAAAYAIVAYQTAWLKCYYPVEFMAALITSVLGHPSKTTEYILHLKTLGIDLLPPAINESFAQFSVENGKVRFGLASIKNVGKAFIDNMTKERTKNGPFLSLTDFCMRMETGDLNKRILESLIKAGAFDSLGNHRKQYMGIYKSVLDSVVSGRKHTFDGQMDLFGMTESKDESRKDHFTEEGEWPEDELLTNEKEVLGLYISGHPLMRYAKILERKVSHQSIDLLSTEDMDETGSQVELIEEQHQVYDGQKTVIGGIINQVSRKMTRNDDQMAFLEIEDLYGTIEVIVFPKSYEKYKHLLEEDTVVIIRGRISIQEEQEAKVILERMEFLNVESEAQESKSVDSASEITLWIRFRDKNDYMENRPKLIRFIEGCQVGSSEIVFYIEEEKKKLKYRQGIHMPPKIQEEFENLVGKQNVKVVKKS